MLTSFAYSNPEIIKYITLSVSQSFFKISLKEETNERKILFREYLLPLGKLVSLEMGKIVPEGVGEVQVSS